MTTLLKLIHVIWGDVGWSYEDRTNQFEYKDDSSNKQRFLHAKNGSDDVATMYKCNIDTRSQKWRKNQKVQLRAMTLLFFCVELNEIAFKFIKHKHR